MSATLNDRIVDRVLFLTKDPSRPLDGLPVSAMSTMLYRVCGNDREKFDEAMRLIELFVREALT